METPTIIKQWLKGELPYYWTENYRFIENFIFKFKIDPHPLAQKIEIKGKKIVFVFVSGFHLLSLFKENAEEFDFIFYVSKIPHESPTEDCIAHTENIEEMLKRLYVNELDVHLLINYIVYYNQEKKWKAVFNRMKNIEDDTNFLVSIERKIKIKKILDE